MTAHDSDSTEDWAYLEILDRVMRDGDAGRMRTLDAYVEMFSSNADIVHRVWGDVMTPEPVPDRLIAERYQITRELGRGGQATVYLADDLKLKRPVALKVIPARFMVGDSRQLIRLEREAGAASRLDHPGICTIYDSGRDEGMSYIAMQFVEGKTLAQVIARMKHRAGAEDTVTDSGELPTQRRMVELITNVASALASAHEARIIHRDIKPGNVMVTPTGEPVILDFGLARDDGGTLPTLTVTGDSMGTPAYMAPEQWRGTGVGPSADVWALGVMLYEGLTLSRPFEGPTHELLAERVRAVPHQDPRRWDSSIPVDLKVVMDVALEKDSQRRYPDAGALAADLSRFLRHEPVLARPIGMPTRIRRWVQRNRLAASFVASLTVLILGALGASIYISVESARSAEALRAERNDKQEALDQWSVLDDLRKLRDLKLERDGLWPATPEQAPVIRQWLIRARTLRDTLRSRAAALAEVGQRAFPYTASDRALDRAANVQLDPLAADAARIYADVLSAWEGEGQRREQVEDQRGLATDRLERRRTWRFEFPWDASNHDAWKRIVVLLDDLGPWIEEMENRLAFAESVDQQSVESHREAWARCITAVESNPAYAGLKLTPQRGLVPLGPDPASGLQEFAHLQSGDVASRDQSRRLEIGDATGLVFVLVPGGSFHMGAVKVKEEQPSGQNRSRYASGNEEPVREVTLGPFFLSKYEVTCGQWLRVAGKLPPGASGEGLTKPVGDVTWNDARRVLGRLDLGFPTEARWEYACRAGTRSSFYWGEDWKQVVQFENTATEEYRGYRGEGVTDHVRYLADVGYFKANPWGFHDMGGNLAEWCADPWVPDYSERLVEGVFTVNHRGERQFNNGYNCVLRGGYFGRVPASARSSYRSAQYGAFTAQFIGLRPVRELTP